MSKEYHYTARTVYEDSVGVSMPGTEYILTPEEARKLRDSLISIMPVEIVFSCPQCCEPHVDEARPWICETCGLPEPGCTCVTFAAWLNPPHKSHRCERCNHVWRPSDVQTNGVKETRTKGQRDGNAVPTAA